MGFSTISQSFFGYANHTWKIVLMKKKKKSFYFHDYAASEFNHNNKTNIIKVSLNRVTFLSFIFFSLILIFGIKIIYLSL